MKERQNLGPIVVFNRDITLEDIKAIPSNFCGDIVVHGNFYYGELFSKKYFKEDLKLCCIIPGNLWIFGDIFLTIGKLIIKGDLHCVGDGVSRRGDFGYVDVESDYVSPFETENRIYKVHTESIEVDGDFSIIGDGDVYIETMTVGGSFTHIGHGDLDFCKNIIVKKDFSCIGDTFIYLDADMNVCGNCSFDCLGAIIIDFLTVEGNLFYGAEIFGAYYSKKTVKGQTSYGKCKLDK